MELFIRIVNGQPFEHPIHPKNFIEAFPDVDVNNLPPEFARFVRSGAPRLGPYEKNQTVTYELVNGVYTDVFHCEQMTDEEILNKQNSVKEAWALTGISSWTFNETTCLFEAPVPYPRGGKIYYWDDPTTSWKIAERNN